MVAYRLVHDVSFFKKRSFCPKCHKTIAWYDNIPIVSWLILRGKCRVCKQKISLIYPFIELFTVFPLTLLFYQVPSKYLFGYFIFFSALIVTLRTDIETMLISRYVTIFLIPFGVIISYLNLIPLTINQSLLGMLFGFLALFLISKIFYWTSKKEGLGQGDIELLSFIGSFTGIIGGWITLLIGSILGSIFGIIMLFSGKLKLSVKIPFGPFLALSAMVYVLYQNEIVYILFGLK